MKKHITHIKKIEYTPSDGFRFIRRSTHEFLKTRNELSFTEIRINSIVESDFVGERFICTDDEEVRDFLEFYERQKEGVKTHVFLKMEFKEFIEIPKDEYEHELILFSNAMLSNNKTVVETATKQQKRDPLINEEIDRAFEEAQKKLDAIMRKVDNYGANAEHYSIDDLWHSETLIGRGWRSADF